MTICTFEQWTALSDSSNNSTSSKLSDRKFHEKKWNATDEERNEIWQQENA